MKLCECGCGLPVRFRFVRGHSKNHFKGGKVKLFCLFCGNGFEIFPTKLRKGQRCCSTYCSSKLLWAKKSYRIQQMRRKRSKTYLRNARKSGAKGRQDKQAAEKRIRNILKASAIRPNSWELKLDSIIQSILPNEYHLNVLGDVVIDKAIPDFVNVNGQKKIIELFGERWHAKIDEQKRKERFGQFGYETLVVWGSELYRPNRLKRKILQFHSMDPK